MFQRLFMTLHNVVISNDSDVIYFKWEPHLTKIRRMDPDTKVLDVVGELQNN